MDPWTNTCIQTNGFLPLHSLWWEKEMKLKELLIPDATLNILFCSYWWTRQSTQEFCPRHFIETTIFAGGGEQVLQQWFEAHFWWVLSSKWISPIIFWALTVGSTTFTGDVARKSFEKPQEQSHAECVSEGLGCSGRTWWKLVSQRFRAGVRLVEI